MCSMMIEVQILLTHEALKYRKLKNKCGGIIFATFADTITPQEYSLRIVHHVILVTLNVAIDSLWTFF